MAQAVTEFQSLLGQLAQELQDRIATFLASVSELDQPDLLAFITDTGPELLLPFIQAAGDLTAVWYEDQDPASDFTATPADPPSLDDLAATARWAMLQADPAVAWGGAATKSLFDTSRQTVVTNADTEGVRWVRHAQEGACGFCRLLAVRSVYFRSYKSKETALAVRHTDETGHDHCNCTAVPNRGGDYVAPPYVAQWKRDYETARKTAGKNPGSIANAMDYLPGGRRYKGDDAPPHNPKPKPINLDAPKPKPAPTPTPADTAKSDAATAKRLLPGLEQSLANLRAQGLPEDSPQIQYHLEAIARLRRQLQRA